MQDLVVEGKAAGQDSGGDTEQGGIGHEMWLSWGRRSWSLVYIKERKVLMAILWCKEKEVLLIKTGGHLTNIRREVKGDMLLFSHACSDAMISEFRFRVADQVSLLVQVAAGDGGDEY